jgi:hypothetical protein
MDRESGEEVDMDNESGEVMERHSPIDPLNALTPVFAADGLPHLTRLELPGSDMNEHYYDRYSELAFEEQEKLEA